MANNIIDKMDRKPISYKCIFSAPGLCTARRCDNDYYVLSHPAIIHKSCFVAVTGYIDRWHGRWEKHYEDVGKKGDADIKKKGKKSEYWCKRTVSHTDRSEKALIDCAGKKWVHGAVNYCWGADSELGRLDNDDHKAVHRRQNGTGALAKPAELTNEVKRVIVYEQFMQSHNIQTAEQLEESVNRYIPSLNYCMRTTDKCDMVDTCECQTNPNFRAHMMGQILTRTDHIRSVCGHRSSLFPYQEKLQAAIDPFSAIKKLLVRYRTGSGKTQTIFSILNNFIHSGEDILVITCGELKKQFYQDLYDSENKYPYADGVWDIRKYFRKQVENTINYFTEKLSIETLLLGQRVQFHDGVELDHITRYIINHMEDNHDPSPSAMDISHDTEYTKYDMYSHKHNDFKDTVYDGRLMILTQAEYLLMLNTLNRTDNKENDNVYNDLCRLIPRSFINKGRTGFDLGDLNVFIDEIHNLENETMNSEMINTLKTAKRIYGFSATLNPTCDIYKQLLSLTDVCKNATAIYNYNINMRTLCHSAMAVSLGEISSMINSATDTNRIVICIETNMVTKWSKILNDLKVKHLRYFKTEFKRSDNNDEINTETVRKLWNDNRDGFNIMLLDISKYGTGFNMVGADKIIWVTLSESFDTCQQYLGRFIRACDKRTGPVEMFYFKSGLLKGLMAKLKQKFLQLTITDENIASNCLINANDNKMKHWVVCDHKPEKAKPYMENTGYEKREDVYPFHIAIIPHPPTTDLRLCGSKTTYISIKPNRAYPSNVGTHIRNGYLAEHANILALSYILYNMTDRLSDTPVRGYIEYLQNDRLEFTQVTLDEGTGTTLTTAENPPRALINNYNNRDGVLYHRSPKHLPKHIIEPLQLRKYVWVYFDGNQTVYASLHPGEYWEYVGLTSPPIFSSKPPTITLSDDNNKISNFFTYRLRRKVFPTL